MSRTLSETVFDGLISVFPIPFMLINQGFAPGFWICTRCKRKILKKLFFRTDFKQALEQNIVPAIQKYAINRRYQCKHTFSFLQHLYFSISPYKFRKKFNYFCIDFSPPIFNSSNFITRKSHLPCNKLPGQFQILSCLF